LIDISRLDTEIRDRIVACLPYRQIWKRGSSFLDECHYIPYAESGSHEQDSQNLHTWAEKCLCKPVLLFQELASGDSYWVHFKLR